MKSLLALAFIVTIVAFSGNAVAEEKAYVPTQDEELFGTWVNPDYNTESEPAKTVLNPDGTSLSYGTEDSTLGRPGKFSITDKWSDSEGNVWYKYSYTFKMGGYSETRYQLVRISNSGKTRESVYSRAECPKELDSNHPLKKIISSFPLITTYAKAIINDRVIIKKDISSPFDSILGQNIYFFDAEYNPNGTKNGPYGMFLLGWMNQKGEAKQLFVEHPAEESKILEDFRTR